MSKHIDHARCSSIPPRSGATQGLAEPKPRNTRGHTGTGHGRALGANMVMLTAGVMLTGGWIAPPPCAAQQSMGLGLKVGETYVLKDLAANATPEVRYDDNSRCFYLQCSAPGKCSVLAAAAGHGSVNATLKNGDPMIFDVTVSSLATAGKPLKPGSAPPPAGDIFANKPVSTESGPVAATRWRPRRQLGMRPGRASLRRWRRAGPLVRKRRQR